MRTAWVLLTGLALAGCELVDQTTFAPSPEAAPTVAEQPRADPRTPLLIIGFADPDHGYQTVLRYAVNAAETRAPGVQYDVVALLVSDANSGVAQQRAVEVMREIMAQGVPDTRIHLGLRTAGAGNPPEVRVYVR